MSKEQILNRNRILYEINQPLSVKTRAYDTIVQPFENQVYYGQETMIASLPTGKYYVDPEKSYVSVKIRCFNSGATICSANFGTGSIGNIVRNLRLFHKSGTQITSGQDMHLWYKARDYVQKDKFWFDTVGTLQGYLPIGPNNLDPDSFNVISQQAVQYKIKLSELHGFFKGYNSKLLPPEIVRDLRIEIDLNPVGQVLVRNVAENAIDNYELTKPEIQLCLVKVMDNASANVNDMSVKQGLNWAYDDVHVVDKNFAENENQVVVSVDKSVSVAKEAITVYRNQPSINNIDADGYRFIYLTGTVNNPTRWSYTIGSDMYPYKKKIDEQFDSYSTCIDAFQIQHGVNLDTNTYFNTNALHTTNLQTDDYLEMSGMFINTNQKLEFQMDKQTTVFPTRFSTMLTYVKVLRVNDANSRVDV